MGGEGEPDLLGEWLTRVAELERKAQPVMEWVMCPTCCGFVRRKKRSAMPNPDQMLADAEKMRAAVVPKHPLVDEEEVEILLRRRMMMVEHKRCPTCYRSVSDTPETKPCKEDMMVAAADETMGADSRSKQTVVAGDETMGADAGSKKKNKRSKEDGKKNKRSKKKKTSKEGVDKNKRSMEDSEYSMGRTGKSSSESNEYSMGRSGKSSSESNEYSMGRSGKRSSDSSQYSMGRSGKSSSEYPMGLTGKSSSEGSEDSTGKPRTKMVTCRLNKEFVQEFTQTHPPIRPFTNSTSYHFRSLLARQIAEYEVMCEVHAYWQSQCDIKGYVEYQEEVTDHEDA